LNVKFTRPSDLGGGGYDYIAAETATATNTAPAQAVTASAVAIDAPTVDLSTAFAATTPVRVSPGRAGSAVVSVLNEGNVTATGTITLTLYTSSDPTPDASDTVLTTLSAKTISLRAGKSLKLHVRFDAPAGAAAGSYYLVASVSSTVQPADANPSNDAAAVATA
jgi:hypothetical protein